MVGGRSLIKNKYSVINNTLHPNSRGVYKILHVSKEKDSFVKKINMGIY